MKKQGPLTSCDTCGNYVYDDDYGYYLCEADLDEDEMAAFLSNQRFVCPYYQTDDEYEIVRKQMLEAASEITQNEGKQDVVHDRMRG